MLTAKNSYGKDLNVELRCAAGSKVKAFAAVGDDQTSVSQIDAGCGKSFTLKNGQVGGIDVYLDSGSEVAIIRITAIKSLSTEVIIGIAIGSLVLLAAIGFGIYCCIKKRRGSNY